MLASIGSILLWVFGVLAALLVLLISVLFAFAYISERRTLRDLESDDPARREHAAKGLRDQWRTHGRVHQWLGEDWRSRIKAEQLTIKELSSTKYRTRIEAVMYLGKSGFAESVPKLILLLDSQDKTIAFLAGEALKAITERLEIRGGYTSMCPRCDSPQTREGNFTGWVCQTCELRYSPKGSRDPLAFGLTGGFHGGPWDRREFVRLLDAVNQLAADALLEGAKGKLASSFSADAERMLAERRRILEA